MNFDESVNYLYSLGNEVEAMKLGLENIRKLLVALRNPHENYLKVQVAGTNGKGSVCVFLEAICMSAGIKTGLYTSPHLISITERIKINGHDICDEDFARHASVVRETAEKLLDSDRLEYRPTFFEQITATALIAFAEAKVELAILETGLGGRLDATTAANAEIAAITRIDLDHQEYLGNTLAEIAGEKAAIIHERAKVVIGEQKSEAMNVLTSFSTNLGVSPRLVEKNVSTTCGSEWLKLETEKAAYEIQQLGLLGRHQIENAKIAILLAETLQDHFPLTTENIISGLQNARHPGRLEFSGRYLFDGAHNVAGAKALRDYLDEFGLSPVTMIFGAMSGKEVSNIAEILFPKAHLLILTRPSNSRALTAERIVELVPANWLPNRVWSRNNVAEALEIAKHDSDGGLILVTGSLYLVGEIKKLLNN